MDSVHFSAGAPPAAGTHAVITRVDGTAVAGRRGRPRGRPTARHPAGPTGGLFLSIDTWHGAVFDRLAAAMLADLPSPLYTVVDEADLDLTARWERAGFTVRRREWEYLVPTDPLVTGLGAALPPSGVTIVGLGAAREAPLREVDRGDPRRGRRERGLGARCRPRCCPGRTGAPAGPGAVRGGRGADGTWGWSGWRRCRGSRGSGWSRSAAGQRRRGIARAMLAEVLGALHRGGIETATAEVDESNTAATALFEGIGARRVGGNLEMVAAGR